MRLLLSWWWCSVSNNDSHVWASVTDWLREKWPQFRSIWVPRRRSVLKSTSARTKQQTVQPSAPERRNTFFYWSPTGLVGQRYEETLSSADNLIKCSIFWGGTGSSLQFVRYIYMYTYPTFSCLQGMLGSPQGPGQSKLSNRHQNDRFCYCGLTWSVPAG